jgi:putative addiction module CopG family antidote
MSIDIRPQDVELILRQVEDGDFPATSDVIHEALIALDEHERLELLRALIQEGEDAYARGEYVEWTPTLMDEIWERAKEMARSGVAIPDHVRP